MQIVVTETAMANGNQIQWELPVWIHSSIFNQKAMRIGMIKKGRDEKTGLLISKGHQHD